MRSRARGVLAVVACAIMLVTGTPAADAHHGCYPGPCTDGDARLRGMVHSRVMFMHRRNPVVVKGANPGAPSVIRTSLRMRRAMTRARGDSTFFVGADRGYQVLFVARPRRGNGSRLRACTRALPNDADPSNNCGGSRVRFR